MHISSAVDKFNQANKADPTVVDKTGKLITTYPACISECGESILYGTSSLVHVREQIEKRIFIRFSI